MQITLEDNTLIKMIQETDYNIEIIYILKHRLRQDQ